MIHNILTEVPPTPSVEEGKRYVMDARAYHDSEGRMENLGSIFIGYNDEGPAIVGYMDDWSEHGHAAPNILATVAIEHLGCTAMLSLFDGHAVLMPDGVEPGEDDDIWDSSLVDQVQAGRNLDRIFNVAGAVLYEWRPDKSRFECTGSTMTMYRRTENGLEVRDESGGAIMGGGISDAVCSDEAAEKFTAYREHMESDIRDGWASTEGYYPERGDQQFERAMACGMLGSATSLIPCLTINVRLPGMGDIPREGSNAVWLADPVDPTTLHILSPANAGRLLQNIVDGHRTMQMSLERLMGDLPRTVNEDTDDDEQEDE